MGRLAGQRQLACCLGTRCDRRSQHDIFQRQEFRIEHRFIFDFIEVCHRYDSTLQYIDKRTSSTLRLHIVRISTRTRSSFRLTYAALPLFSTSADRRRVLWYSQTCSLPALMSYPEIGSFNRRIIPHLFSGTAHGDVAVFEHIAVIGNI